MIIREATINDIDKYMTVRMAVKENPLNNPALVTRNDNIDYITKFGKGWVCDIDQHIVGFSIVGLAQRNIWALFVLPGFEGKNIGRNLHDIMLNWYFSQTKETVWLGTAPNTRAEKFYRKSGWIETGKHGQGEIKFEMKYDNWKAVKVSSV